MNIEIDLADDSTDVGIGFGQPPLSIDDLFILRVCDCRLILNADQAEELAAQFARYFKAA